MERYALRYFHHHPEAAALSEAYRANHDMQLELMGRISAALASKFRNDPLDTEHIGQQEKVIGMSQGILEYLET